MGRIKDIAILTLASGGLIGACIGTYYAERYVFDLTSELYLYAENKMNETPTPYPTADMNIYRGIKWE